MALHHLAPGEKVRIPPPTPCVGAGALALVKTDGFEAVELLLHAGQRISKHTVPGHCTIHCLEGSVILETKKPIELGAGDWLYLDRGEEHSVTAVQQGLLLVTIIFD